MNPSVISSSLFDFLQQDKYYFVIVKRGQDNKDDETSGCVSRCAYVCQHEYFRGPDRVVVTEHHQNEDMLLSRAEGGEEQDREGERVRKWVKSIL